MLELIRIALGLLLVLFVPGYAMVYALFPRRGELDLEYDHLYRIFLAVGMSIVASIIVGFLLNSLGVKADGTGYFTAFNIALALLLLTALGTLIAWFRGAFPILSKVHPLLHRTPARGPMEMAEAEPFLSREQLEEIEELASERNLLAGRLDRLKKRTDTTSSRAEMAKLSERLGRINERLEELDMKRRSGP